MHLLLEVLLRDYLHLDLSLQLSYLTSVGPVFFSQVADFLPEVGDLGGLPGEVILLQLFFSLEKHLGLQVLKILLRVLSVVVSFELLLHLL